MSKKHFIGIGIFILIGLFAPCAWANAELVKKVPEAKDFTVLYKLNPLEFPSRGYTLDIGEAFTGTLKRVAYFLRTVDKTDKESWVFVSMDPFTQDIGALGVPIAGSPVFQTYVNNLEVFSNVPGVKTGKFEKGNIEFWPSSYGADNRAKIPGATPRYDFGDSHQGSKAGYGSMQVHNYLEKQTILAFNNLNAGRNCDIGIGNSPKGHPDWTFSKNGNNLKSAEIIVAAQIENLKKTDYIPLNPQLVTLRGEAQKAFYAPNEPMEFVFTVDFGKQPQPQKPYYIKWTRTGDDGKRADGRAELIPGKPVVVKTSLATPGFVRMQAFLTNSRGLVIRKKNHQGKFTNIAFNGGAGVEIEKLKPAAEEPADFDAFWDRQKEKLAKVPLKYTMTKVSKPDAKVEVYAVSVDCAGPRPVTGYLTIPAGAKAKSLPASASFHGYGTSVQRAPATGPENRIHFNVNAHGYELDKDAAYYKDFFAKIQSNGQIYAFDPKQNSDPEAAYFNGMALRVMRALQFLKALPQWNGKSLSVSGGSQGGLQTIWAAALDPDVTYADSHITWCCDFAGTTIKRLGGWRPKYVPALNYYDSVFHAKRIKCQIQIGRAGLGDYVCPPSGLAILYNNLNAPKKIVWVQGSDHGFVPKNPQRFIIEEKKK